jgi:hypothetical protein
MGQPIILVLVREKWVRTSVLAHFFIYIHESAGPLDPSADNCTADANVAVPIFV